MGIFEEMNSYANEVDAGISFEPSYQINQLEKVVTYGITIENFENGAVFFVSGEELQKMADESKRRLENIMVNKD